MNTFKFIGNLVKTKDGFITDRGNFKTLKIGVKQNENNIGFVQLTAFPVTDNIRYYNKKTKKFEYINSSKRFDTDILKEASYKSKYITNIGSIDKKDIEFLTPMDLLDHLEMNMDLVTKDDLITVEGNFFITEYNGKFYNDFEIQSIYINRDKTPDLHLYLDLFYNNKSLDLSDFKNRMILNSYIQQYNRKTKQKEYYPLTVQFNTSNYDLNNETQKAKLKYRKLNLNPTVEEGYVKSKWECQYVRGAQYIIPPKESLPESVRFEIENAGRDLKDYMTKVVGEAKEIICLIRPDNLLSVDNQVYEKIEETNKEFEDKIFKNNIILEENKTIDSIAKKEADENPFN